MGEKHLIPINRSLPANSHKANSAELQAIVDYEKIDSIHYSFSYHFEDGTDLHMEESEQTAEATDFVEAEYESGIEESDKIYYSAAAACGILTGTLSTLHFTEEQLTSIKELKEKDWKPVIIKVANLIGYQKTDYKGAAKYLVDRAVRTIEKSDKAQETVAILAEHPSITGLVFSLITQFSGKEIAVTDKGTIRINKLPDYYIIGDTNPEKIVCAFLYWLFSLGIDEAMSHRRDLDEMFISRELLNRIKEFSNLPFFKNLPSDYIEAEILFSNWLGNIIKGAELYAEEENEEKTINPLFALMGIALNLAKDSFPVLLNECIVRSMYILIRLCSESRERRITSLEQLTEIPTVALLPSDGRILSKMCLIASASFAGANIAGAVLKAIREKKVNGRKFSDTLLTELNFAGIGRFLFACAADSKYWGDEVRIHLHRDRKDKDSFDNGIHDEGEDIGHDPLFMDAIQAQVLFGLESLYVQYDIEHTEKEKEAKIKALWLETWKNTILAGVDVSTEAAEQYFIEDEDVIYNGIHQLAQDNNNWRWIYLLTQELALFEPYTRLGSPKDKEFKKLKCKSDYVRDQFVRRQTVVSQDEVDKIAKRYGAIQTIS